MNVKPIPILIFILAAGVLHPACRAAEEGLPTRIASAVTKCDAVVKQAEDACRRAKLSAKNALFREINSARAEALAAKKLDEVNQIDEMKKQLAAEIAELTQGIPSGNVSRAVPRKQTLKITAKGGWQQVGKVKQGQKVTIAAAGTWVLRSTDPKDSEYDVEGHRPNGRIAIYGGYDAAFYIGALIGRVTGQDPSVRPFLIGKSCEMTFPNAGMLEMRVNEGDQQLVNNMGEVTVTIQEH